MIPNYAKKWYLIITLIITLKIERAPFFSEWSGCSVLGVLLVPEVGRGVLLVGGGLQNSLPGGDHPTPPPHASGFIPLSLLTPPTPSQSHPAVTLHSQASEAATFNFNQLDQRLVFVSLPF
jgi:hypothetical protein